MWRPGLVREPASRRRSTTSTPATTGLMSWPTPWNWSDATHPAPTGRSSGLWRPAWRSAAWPASSSRLNVSWPCWDRRRRRLSEASTPGATATRSRRSAIAGPGARIWRRSSSCFAGCSTRRVRFEGFFLRGHDGGHTDVEQSLESFSRRARALAGDAHPRLAGVSYFFSRPSAGSACKRLNLYLRWMVRADAVDLGAWSGVSPSQLVVPLDVHVIRVGQCLGLTRLRSPGWRMASEITASLREIDPDDPVRYDFALCHLGMHDQCGFNRPFSDSRCPLRGWCRPGRRRRRASGPPSDRR